MKKVAPRAVELGLGISMKPHGCETPLPSPLLHFLPLCATGPRVASQVAVGAARTCLSNADLLEVVKEVDQPGFGISLDPGNVVYYTHRHVDGEEPVRNPFPSCGGLE